MEAVGALAAEFPDTPIQTHLSENHAEIAYAEELFPEHKDYASVYAHYGLMRANALYGHAIHLSAAEMAMMAESGAVAVSCPTSNLFLGSRAVRSRRSGPGRHAFGGSPPISAAAPPIPCFKRSTRSTRCSR